MDEEEQSMKIVLRSEGSKQRSEESSGKEKKAGTGKESRGKFSSSKYLSKWNRKKGTIFSNHN